VILKMVNKSNMKFGVMVILTVMILFSGMASAEIPSAPTSLDASVNEGWVNYTWVAGAGNVTDTFNVSMSVSGATRTWDNSSSNLTSNNNVGLDEWAEIWIYAYNTTGSGNLSSGYAYADTQADRSSFGELIDLMQVLPDVIYPVLAVMVIIIIIRAYASVGSTISGILGTITDIIKKGMGKK
jgi:hypothetical protein